MTIKIGENSYKQIMKIDSLKNYMSITIIMIICMVYGLINVSH